MPKIDVSSVPLQEGSTYPSPFHLKAAGRTRQALGDAGGLTDFGVNLLMLPPGAWSSQRHWHSGEDEFVYVLEGELVLITDEGEQVVRTGDCLAFPKNVSNGHHLVNKSDKPAVCLEVGTRSDDDVCSYPDIDMRIDAREGRYTRRDGTPYPKRESGA
jgi:uncharacterized cupin superfamily protein